MKLKELRKLIQTEIRLIRAGSKRRGIKEDSFDSVDRWADQHDDDEVAKFWNSLNHNGKRVVLKRNNITKHLQNYLKKDYWDLSSTDQLVIHKIFNSEGAAQYS